MEFLDMVAAPAGCDDDDDDSRSVVGGVHDVPDDVLVGLPADPDVDALDTELKAPEDTGTGQTIVRTSPSPNSW